MPTVWSTRPGLHFDPDRAVADEEEALERRGVWLRRNPAHPATTDVSMTLDTDDAELLDQTVGPDRRRPQGSGRHRHPRRTTGQGGRDPGRSPVRPRPDVRARRGSAHYRLQAVTGWCTSARRIFADGTGVADIEKLGAITTDLLATWLARHDLGKTVFRVRPVLDLNADWSVDRHDPRSGCASRSCCSTRPASSPAAAATPGPATSTTSRSTSSPGRRWTTGPDKTGEPRPAVPHPPPDQDPHRLDLQTPGARPLHLDQPHRPPVRRHVDDTSVSPSSGAPARPNSLPSGSRKMTLRTPLS